MIRGYLEVPDDWFIQQVCFLGETIVIAHFRHVSGAELRVWPYWTEDEPHSSHRITLEEQSGEVETLAEGQTTSSVEKACFEAVDAMREYSP